ncbi:MAG: response regulator [Syntrophales bacterium]|nr:response regulator [Syntrophales bacterium]
MPVIFCTGHNKSSTKEEAQMHGIREFALKPVNPSMLAALIRKVLDK